VSTFKVSDVIVKGLKAVSISSCAGKSFIDKVTWLLPVNTLKLGKNLLSAKNTSA